MAPIKHQHQLQSFGTCGYLPPLGSSKGVHAGSGAVGVAVDAVERPQSAITGAFEIGQREACCLVQAT